MRRKFPLLLVLLTVLVAGIAYRRPWAGKPGLDGTLTLFGNVDIRKVDLGFRVTGRIAEMPFQEGARVAAGDLLARLDEIPYRIELDLALAQEAQAAAQLAKLEAGSRPPEIAQAEALVRERQVRADNLDVEYGRLAALLAEGAVARQLADDARANLAEARARLATAREGLKLAREGFRGEDIAAARADLRAAQARVAVARNRLSDSECRAPDGGVILTRVEEPGAIVAAGQTVLTLALDTPVWIRAYVEEPDLGRIRPGMAAEIQTDSRPEPYGGHIGYISPEAEFTPKTVQTEELRTKLVYQLRVIADDPDHGLRQGMPVTVTIVPDEPSSRPQ
ncbi:HlyD family efflux transporter periplasmic adaptor subunit [Trichloromonas sp.]|uniref:HlyD family efflux transporter periplasmic adaptor subunit n=1 Tax=Trichloromonas sp. TaxID=3069249 RepID=UPI002A412699|nr:efflux RND transporter periplasmic adaptor subunit [Trichloromonas sp.]